MSRPPTFTPPPGARAYSPRTVRGEFAAVDSPVRDGAAPVRPGRTGSKEDFNPLLEALGGRGYRTVAVDGRGQYKSHEPEHDDSAYAQAELEQHVLAQAAALDTPVHLVGHSLGGQIA